MSGIPGELYCKLLTLRAVSKKHGVGLWLNALRPRDLGEMLLDWRDDRTAMRQFAAENLSPIRDLAALRLPYPVLEECYDLISLLEYLVA